ncbi:MAG: hypothetical protein ACYDCO_27125 [Armatimonadota bacterium]
MPRSFWDRLKSRKFILIVATGILILLTAINKDITWTEAVRLFVLSTLGYLGVEGLIDYKALPKS